ncbi:hypothetical protein PFICI_13797 [Pestalotiopsis fici W106-1]|uniref:SnoaL-like domain-containing protein n=1 Tax=Pestalotiopsis fici (strain W106-1 / CGMCC3.15140) TaxID=1229662 RepID=W3WM91_PESFW|nr:uncharacterized protein PFICI_13797 [Pestalotiopsis fici W106-1]ETS73931.1 hypothetical protein PFICI_13797 [Pestalotiopsis fici W106-1]
MNGLSVYEKLRQNAKTFIEAYSFTPEAGQPNIDVLTSFMSSNFTLAWGHTYMTQRQPRLSKALDQAGFREHMGAMVPFIESTRIVIHDIIVDEPARKVVVRASFCLCPKGQNEGEKEAPENELMWILKFDQEGEQLESAVEFLDATATARIGELVAQAKQKV